MRENILEAKTTAVGTMNRRCGAIPALAQESLSLSGRQSRWAEGLNWPTICWLAAIHVGALAAPFTFSWAGLIALLLLVWMTGGVGVCLGYHRLFTHGSFVVVRPVRWSIAVLGSLAGQGALIDWVADHRKHHALSDREGDPHSPNDGAWWSHVLWLTSARSRANQAHRRRWAPDLLNEPVLVWIDRLFIHLHLLFAATVFGLGYWIGGVVAACSLLVWGILLRLVFVFHTTWLVNSASHMWGYRTYPTRDNSRNLWWVALLTFGEGWHNNHHAFPRMACNRHRWWEFDLNFEVVRLLRSLGLARDVIEDLPARSHVTQVAFHSTGAVLRTTVRPWRAIEAVPATQSPATPKATSAVSYNLDAES